jgi:hypothetical protein
MMEEWAQSGRPAMGSRPIAANQDQQIEQGMDQSNDPQPAQAGHETINALRKDPAEYQVSGSKADPLEVAYRWADGDQQCANCLYFSAEGRDCSKVEGFIHPDAVCDLWEAVPSFQSGSPDMRTYSAYEMNLAHAIFGDTFAAEKAPVGGVEVQGTFYPGGQFIPAEVVAEATEEEKAEIEGEAPAEAPTGEPAAPAEAETMGQAMQVFDQIKNALAQGATKEQILAQAPDEQWQQMASSMIDSMQREDAEKMAERDAQLVESGQLPPDIPQHLTEAAASGDPWAQGYVEKRQELQAEPVEPPTNARMNLTDEQLDV